MEPKFSYPSDTSKIIHNMECPPATPQPGPQFDSDYMDGSTAKLEGANPGRDQDRSRVDECIYATYHYREQGSGTERENETGTMEGY